MAAMASPLENIRCALYNMQMRIWQRAILFQGQGGDAAADSRLFPVPFPPDDSQLPLDSPVDFSSFEIEDSYRERVRRACAEILGCASSINEKQPISINGMHMNGFEYFATQTCLRFMGNAVAYAEELRYVVVPDFVRFLSEMHHLVGSDEGAYHSIVDPHSTTCAAAADFVDLAGIGYEIACARRSIAVSADMLARAPAVFGYVPPQPDVPATLADGNIRPVEIACDAIRFVDYPLRSYALRRCASAIARSADGQVVLAAHMLDMSQLSIVYQATRRFCTQVSKKRRRRAAPEGGGGEGADLAATGRGECEIARAFLGRNRQAAVASIDAAAPRSQHRRRVSPPFSQLILDPALSAALERAARRARATTDRLLLESAAYVFD